MGRRINVQSALLTQFWGHPCTSVRRCCYRRVTISIPTSIIRRFISKDTSDSALRSDSRNSPATAAVKPDTNRETVDVGDFPRVIAVTFQHPTPYFDDSYAVNSANNGPYGDALLKELIPYLQQHFRISTDPRDRVLKGASHRRMESLRLAGASPGFLLGHMDF